MIINPSSLFKLTGGKWKYVCGKPNIVKCYCPLHNIGAAKLNPLNRLIISIPVLLTENIFLGKNKVTISKGMCESCKTIYWSCDNFDWVEWLSDKKLLETILTGMEVKDALFDEIDSDITVPAHRYHFRSEELEWVK